MIPESEYEDLLRLSAVPGIGPNKLRALIARFKSAKKVFLATRAALTTVPGIDRKIAANVRSFDGKDYAKRQLERLDKSGARFVTFWHADYPEALKQIYDPPAFLFLKGEFAEPDKNSIAIVGTRSPSQYGKLVAEKFAIELSRSGMTIVSGLAYGIDTIAHSSALQSGGRTIAVLGSGVDVVYPSENIQLAKKICHNGAVISEFPLGAKPDRTNFPRRNRIIGGLSLGIVVVEAGQKSGALITASMALEQNREVFAVPGNIDSPRSLGTNQLIKQGAKPVTSPKDILEDLRHQLAFFSGDNLPAASMPQSLSGDEKRLLELLSNEPRHIDEIALTTGQSTAKTLSTLLLLELKNLVKQQPGKLFVRV